MSETFAYSGDIVGCSQCGERVVAFKRYVDWGEVATADMFWELNTAERLTEGSPIVCGKCGHVFAAYEMCPLWRLRGGNPLR